MRFLLDTNVISELRKRPGVADPNVVAWAAACEIEDLALSVISILEIELGIARVERRDPRQGSTLRTWFERAVLTDLRRQILPADVDVARRAALLHVPDPRPERDAWIAATALVHGLVVVTRNVSDFRPMQIELIDPWLRPDLSDSRATRE